MAQHTEVTVSTAKMVAAFLGLVILCAAFFGLGFVLGRDSERGTVLAGSSTPAVTVTGVRPSSTPEAAPSAPDVPPAASSTGNFFVQVAAVSKQEDAEALVGALRKKQYSAIATSNQPSDALFHVQVGPFAERKDAEDTKTRLVKDGYNPILKK
jgi:cell division septation protein DedD